MAKPEIRIHITEKDEIIDREMNDEEYKQFLKDKESFDKLQLAEQARTAKRLSAADKLRALGLDEAEVAALLG